MIWPHLFSTILFFLCPFFVHSTPQTLAIYLPTNMSNLLVPWVLALLFSPLLRMLFVQMHCMAIPFSSFGFQVLGETYSDRSNAFFLFPRPTCNNLFYFSPNTYNSFYLYTCLWSVCPSNLFRAVSSTTR